MTPEILIVGTACAVAILTTIAAGVAVFYGVKKNNDDALCFGFIALAALVLMASCNTNAVTSRSKPEPATEAKP